MKTIYKIARTELQTLFYSPIAWLILVIFTFQASMAFTNGLAGNVRSQELGYGLYNVTMGVFAGWRGMFIAMQQYLYLYIPLLTMGLMSRELSSGSIKLLYSSPVTNTLYHARNQYPATYPPRSSAPPTPPRFPWLPRPDRK